MTHKYLLVALIATVVCFSPHRSQAQTSDSSQPDLTSAIQSLRADLRADKVAIIKDAMQFSPKDSDAFWPIYNRYAADLTKVNDQRVAAIKTYADKYGTLNDADASDLVKQMLSFEQERLDLKKKYFKEFSGKLPGTVVAKFFQLEHRLDLIIDLKLAATLPSLLDKPAASSPQ